MANDVSFNPSLQGTSHLVDRTLRKRNHAILTEHLKNRFTLYHSSQLTEQLVTQLPGYREEWVEWLETALSDLNPFRQSNNNPGETKPCTLPKSPRTPPATASTT